MMTEAWKGLLYSRKFWMATLVMIQTIIFHLVPSFPEEIWLAITAVMVVVIGAIAYEDGAAGLAIYPWKPKPAASILDVWKRLAGSRKFWLACVALIQTVLFYFVDFPETVWASIDVVLAIVIGAIAYEDGQIKRQLAQAQLISNSYVEEAKVERLKMPSANSPSGG